MLVVEMLGGRVTLLKWSDIYFEVSSQRDVLIVVASAFWIEFAVYGMIAAWGRNALAFGILVAVFLRAVISQDFADVDSPGNMVAFVLLGLVLIGYCTMRLGGEKQAAQKKATL